MKEFCCICCDEKDKKSFIECPYILEDNKCGIRVCSDCFITHNNFSREIDCPGCRKELSIDFIQSNFDPKESNKLYKKKEDIFLAEQKSQLRSDSVQTSASIIMGYEKYYKNSERLNMLKEKLTIKYSELKDYLVSKKYIESRIEYRVEEFLFGLENGDYSKILKKDKKLKKKYDKFLKYKSLLKKFVANSDKYYHEKRELYTKFKSRSENIVTEKRIFTFPCTRENCKGYLTEQYECKLCECTVCRKCHREKVRDHVCKDEDITSVKYIKKNTKPCPNCHTSCIKTEGCDQVFCINEKCYTAWSWSKGTIERGRIHAADYYTILRKRGDIIPRAEGDYQEGCCDIITAHRNIRELISKDMYSLLLHYTGLYNHIQTMYENDT